MTTITATNLDADIGDVVTVKNGFFAVSPWGYKKPTTSERFGLDGSLDGVYTITAKIKASQNDGAAVRYTLTAQA